MRKRVPKALSFFDWCGTAHTDRKVGLLAIGAWEKQLLPINFVGGDVFLTGV
jgi:hypothetical protein